MDKSNLTKIAILGPHDRFNYGDLLFPIVIDYCFSKFLNKNISIDKYSLIESDLSDLGGFYSKSYLSMKNDINRGKKKYIIISGGECLSATWSILYSFINPFYNLFYLKLEKNRIYRNIPKFLLHGKSEYPFSINKDDFLNEIKVFYNAVGGGWQANNIILNRLKFNDGLGVRDLVSYNKMIKNNIITDLVPDSAVMLSEIYPIDSLVKKNNFEGDYIFFQIANHLINTSEFNLIVKNLQKISLSNNLKILLCPIGTAKGHEDHIPLEKIYEMIPNSILIKNPTISDILNYIANSKLYLGTSLHGVITAMNYGVPYVGSVKVFKQVEYIKTWSINELKKSFLDFSDFNIDIVTELLELKLKEKIIVNNIKNQDIYKKFIQKIILKIEK